jgi:DNA-binding transcriptional regulator YiaG
MDVSASMKEARRAMGMTQAQFAAALGVSRNTVNRWERGANKPQRWFLPLIDAPTPTP